jgi:hypothetical protein
MVDGEWQLQAKPPPRQPATSYRHIDNGDIVGLS